MLKIKVCVISQDSETLWDDAIMQQKSAIQDFHLPWDNEEVKLPC